jgi:hypothetical protein
MLPLKCNSKLLVVVQLVPGKMTIGNECLQGETSILDAALLLNSNNIMSEHYIDIMFIPLRGSVKELHRFPPSVLLSLLKRTACCCKCVLTSLGDYIV